MSTNIQKLTNNSLFEQYGALFTFSNQTCKCTLEKNHNKSGNLIYSFYIESENTIYDFFYTTNHGLTRDTSTSASPKNSLIMEEFLSLNLKNITEKKYEDQQTQTDISILENFINQNGFFFEIPPSSRCHIELSSLAKYLQYIQTIINLHIQLTAKSLDYNLIFSYTLMLHCIPVPKLITASPNQIDFPLTEHLLSQYWADPSSLKERTFNIPCSQIQELSDYWDYDPLPLACQVYDYFKDKTVFICEADFEYTPYYTQEDLKYVPNIILQKMLVLQKSHTKYPESL